MGPITLCSRLLCPVDPAPGQTGDSVTAGNSDTQPKKGSLAASCLFSLFPSECRALLRVACFHYSFLLTGVTGSMAGCSGPFAMPSSWGKAAFCDSLKEAAARLLVATCAQGPACQGNPSYGEHTQLFSLGAHREPQKLLLGEQWQGRLLIPESKPSTTAEKFPQGFHQTHRPGCCTKTILHF